jgi:hypothetical protein
MKRAFVGFDLALGPVACNKIAMPRSTSAAAPTGGGAFREYLVLGSTMSFEYCRACGGIIIQDAGNPMIACDPRVRREPVLADEFYHPGSPVQQAAAVVDG